MKECKNCKNKCYGYVCPQYEKKISDRTPCNKYKEYPHGITTRELIAILEKLPQDKEIQIDGEGLFAITGVDYEDGDKVIFLNHELIAW